jgi:hypothetical protein
VGGGVSRACAGKCECLLILRFKSTFLTIRGCWTVSVLSLETVRSPSEYFPSKFSRKLYCNNNINYYLLGKLSEIMEDKMSLMARIERMEADLAVINRCTSWSTSGRSCLM